MKEDYILLIHKFAVEHVNEGFLYNDLTDYLEVNGVEINDRDIKIAINRIVNQDIKTESIHIVSCDSPDRIFINSEAYYRHFNYLEMEAAHESAKNARNWAIRAFYISATLALIQVIIALLQLGESR